MNAFADKGFDFLRWMNELDTESRARLDRFLDLTVEVMPKRGHGRERGSHPPVSCDKWLSQFSSSRHPEPRWTRYGRMERVHASVVEPYVSARFASYALTVQGTPATPDESVAVQKTVTHIRARIESGRTFRAAISRASGSPLDADFVAGHGQDLISHALLWMLSAEEHLLTLADAFSTGDLYAHGPYSLLRGAAEPLARLTWLFDDKVGTSKRYQRLLSERRENQKEFGKLKAFSTFTPTRIQHIDKLATSAGFKANSRADATSLFRRVLKEVGADPARDPLGEVLYRVLSGQIHSLIWALMGQADVVSAPQVGKVGLAKIELDLYLFLKLIDPVYRMHDVAHEHWCRMHGTNQGAWRSVAALLPAHGQLGIEYRRPGSLAENLNL
jgi:hypothetical protein